MRRSLIIYFFIFSSSGLFGQTKEIDSLRNLANDGSIGNDIRRAALTTLIERFIDLFNVDSAMAYSRKYVHLLPDLSDSGPIDSVSISLLTYIGGSYQFFKLDSAIYYSSMALEAARRTKFKRGEAWALQTLGENYRLNGDLTLALDHFHNGVRISRELNDKVTEANCYVFIGLAYIELGENRTGLNYLFQASSDTSVFKISTMVPFAYSNMANAYQNLNQLDSAIYYLEIADSITEHYNWNRSPLKSDILLGFGRLYVKMGHPETALVYYRRATEIGDYLNLAVSQYLQASLFHSLGQGDSSMYYARLAYTNSRRSLQMNRIMETSRLLATLYTERKMTDSALNYTALTLALRDSLYSPENFKRLQLAAVKDQQTYFQNIQKKERAEQEQQVLANRMRIYALISLLAFFLVIAVILYRNNRQKQKSNDLLQQQKEEISIQREKAESALNSLKSTQSQLIQSEKMASLGELTAGIAHEIQNPLNFVNNFSEVNTELIRDLKSEIQKGNLESVSSIATDIEANEEKINHHGKRADAIVKSMLQHSRISSGKKEPTDINALCDEYVRLAYHGYRAKDKSFIALPINIGMETQLDPSLPKVNVVAQDIGRIILNLINNAFFAVNEKSKAHAVSYEPRVTISTRNLGDTIEISVQDNGPGIPDHIKEKIFQPFFTTKPTGQGTGLGLSLSYDIIKAHGGTIEVSTYPGQTVFNVHLPCGDNGDKEIRR